MAHRTPIGLECYVGRVAYVNGAHYPVRFDSDGRELGPDLDRRLLWRDGGYVFAKANDPTHEDLYHRQYVSVDVGEVNP